MVFSGLHVALFAQNIAFPSHDNVVNQTQHIYTIETQLTSSEEVVSHFVQTHTLLSNPRYALDEKAVITSLTGIHYTYTVLKDGFEIFDVELRVHTNHSGHVITVQDNIPSIPDMDLETLERTQNCVWMETSQGWQLPEMKPSLELPGTWLFLVDDRPIHAIQTKLFYQAPDTPVSALVFLVNPLSTAERAYGSPYIDSNDLDVPVINAERKWVTMNAHYENDTFWLQSDRYFMGEITDPVTAPTYSLTDTFSFTRSQHQFEDINAFYHITNMSDYVEDLGFITALPDTLLIDAHGHNGADFSSFNFNVNPLEVEFGEGGVDDAEDGEIVIHEFSHALSHTAGADSYSSTRDRGAMEEGNSDYFSASYSKAYTDYAWKLMFNWDGHNPFFDGVHIGSKLIYPTDMTNSTNHDRELWSTPLMCIYDKIGRAASDSLVLEHLYYQFKNSTIPNMALVLLKVDSLLWDGKYHQEIRNCFAEHDILAGTGQSLVFTQWFNAYNTAGFSFGNSSAEITSKGNQEFSYLIYNSLGQKLGEEKSTNRLSLNPQDFVSGIYFVELNIGSISTYLKILKN